MDFETAGDAPVATEMESPRQIVGEEAPLQAVRLPGEPEVEDATLARPLEAGEQPSKPGEPSPGNADFGERWARVRLALRTRRGRLWLSGALLIGLSAATGAILLSPYGHLSPVAEHPAASRATQRRSPPLAPAASLAGVPVPPAAPVVRPRFEPTAKTKQLQELMSFRNGASAAPPAGKGAASNEEKSGPAIGSPSAPVPNRRETEANNIGASAAVSTAVAAKVASRPATAAVHALPQAAAATHPIPAAAAHPIPPAPAPPKPAAAASTHRPAPAAPSAVDPVVLAAALRPAPMTPKNEVEVLELVTQVATEVRDLREEDGQLRADLARTAADTSAKLADFERRLALVEARHAVAAVRTVDAAPAGDAGPPAASASTRIAAAGVDPNRVVRYRVQAASPGLALLAEIDRGGGEGAQREVLVGDTIPGYGRVEWIGQRGTAWVVETQHGDIE